MTIPNILTVDVEDWFHICGVSRHLPRSSWDALENKVETGTSIILNILKRQQVRATFFILGFVAERYPLLVRRIQAAGHEIATHGYEHRRVYTMTRQTFRRDLRRAVAAISKITGEPVTIYRAPEWSIRDDSIWALDILHEEGIRIDSSMAPLPIIGNPEYPKIPHMVQKGRFGMLEVPPLVFETPLVNLPAGGGWGLRVFPYRFIRNRVRRLNRAGHPALFFVHPREFLTDIPAVGLPVIKKLVLDARIEPTQKRLQRLLKDFRFTTISDALRYGQDGGALIPARPGEPKEKKVRQRSSQVD